MKIGIHIGIAYDFFNGSTSSSYIFNYDFTERFCDDEGNPFKLY
jgi:hypothetical protein